MPIHDWSRVNDGTFHYLHLRWMGELSDRLNDGILPADYYAIAEQYVNGVEPDVLTFQTILPPAEYTGNGTVPHSPIPTGGVLLEICPPPAEYFGEWDAPVLPPTARHITIRHTDKDRLVAIIEIVSPGNKSSRDSIRSFVRKIAEFIAQGVHVLIVDVFPPGPRDPNGIHALIAAEIGGAVFELLSPSLMTFVSYLAGPQRKFYLRTSSVGHDIPEMSLFLSSQVYVRVPLESTYTAAFQKIPHARREGIPGE